MVESMPNFPGMIGRRQKIMGLGFGLLILVFGVVIGSGGTLLHFKDQLKRGRGWERGPDPKPIIQDMKEKLSLTEQQVKQIEELFRQQGQAWMEFNKKTSEFQKQQWEAMITGMKSILTPEQSAAWQKEMDERRQRWDREQKDRFRGQQGPGRGGPGGPDRGEGRRGGRPGQDEHPQGRPSGEPMPGGPGSNGAMPGGPGQPMIPPPGGPVPDGTPKTSEPAPGSTTPKPAEEPKPL